MTVKRLRDEMPNNEFHQWRAFLVYRQSLREKAQKAAEVKAKAQRKGRG